MNKQQTWVTALVAALVMTAGVAKATLYSYNFTSGFDGGATVADGNATGWTDSRDVTGIPTTIDSTPEIVSVTARINVSGGYAGDLYGYLVLTDTSTHTSLGMAVLLNRVGTGNGGNPTLTFGYSDSALNVALSDAGTVNGSIHNYQEGNPGYNSAITSGALYQNDGGSMNAAFGGASANNTWTLFLADLSTGSVMTVNDWGLDIEVVPEPVTWAVLIFGGIVGVVQMRKKFGQRHS